jgi:hypothetical protein
MLNIKSLRYGAIGVLVAVAGAANAFFVPVTVSGSATGVFSGATPGFSSAPGPIIDGSNQFNDTSSQQSGAIGYYGISPVLDSGTFGVVTLVAPVSGTTHYNGTYAVDITFTSPTNTSQVFTASVTGSITGAIVAQHKGATGGVTISFSPTPIYFNYGPGDADWFSLTLNPITFGPKGGTQSITGYGQTYATTPAPAGALVFLVGALRRRRNRA